MKMGKHAIWPICLVGSLAAHVGLLALLSLVVKPETTQDQPIPKSRMSIQTQDVKRTDAQQATAKAESLNEQEPDGATLGQGIVPQSRAEAAPIAANPINAVTPPTDAIRETVDHRKPLIAVSPATIKEVAIFPDALAISDTNAAANFEKLATHLPASQPILQKIAPHSRAETTPFVGKSIDGIRPPANVIQVSSGDAHRASVMPPDATIQAATEPDFVVIPATTARASSLKRIVVTQQTAFKLDLAAAPIDLSITSDRATSAVQLALPAEASNAALAWSGDGSVSVDPSSLAAIQAFMQPNDLSNTESGVNHVRDGIAAILAAVPCARLQTTFIPETGQLKLSGHIPEDALRGPVLTALKRQVGSNIPVSDQLLILPRPQCGALFGISNVGLPQSTEQLTNPRVIGETGFVQKHSYYAGQRLSLELVAPDYDGYVYVDYFVADGTVIHLQPNQVIPLEFAKAKSPLTVGNNRRDKPSLDITIGPPYGQEIIAAFASSVPLHDDVRPLQESATPYLEFLKSRVALARKNHPSFKGEWVYIFISTAEN